MKSYLMSALALFFLTVGMMPGAGDYLDVPTQTATPVPPVAAPLPLPPASTVTNGGGAAPETAAPSDDRIRGHKRMRALDAGEMRPDMPPSPGDATPVTGTPDAEGLRNDRPPSDKRRGEMDRPVVPGAEGRPNRPFPGGFRPGQDQPFFGENRKVMELLFTVPQDKLAEELEKLPKFKERPPEEKQHLIQRIQHMFQERRQEALNRAKAAGITVPAGREDDFTRAFVKSRRDIEETLRKEMEPRRQQLEKDAVEQLRKDFTAP